MVSGAAVVSAALPPLHAVMLSAISAASVAAVKRFLIIPSPFLFKYLIHELGILSVPILILYVFFVQFSIYFSDLSFVILNFVLFF